MSDSSPAIAALSAAVEAAVTDESLLLSAERQCHDLDAIVFARNQLDYLLVKRLQSANSARVIDDQYGRTTRAWLTEDVGYAPALASKLMALVYRLPEYVATERDFARGMYGADHAHAIVKSLRSMPQEIRPTVEQQLIDIATVHEPGEVTRFAERLLEAMGHDKDSDVRRERMYGDRHLRVLDTFNRCGDLRGMLTPETRVKLMTALDRAADKADPEDHRTVAQRYHDALDEILDVYLDATDTPSFAGSPRSAMVLIPLEVLESELSKATARLLPIDAEIGPDTARRLACDAEIIPVVLGALSEVLDLGRASRDFNAAIRRGAWLEQGGTCAFPACQKTPRECHHIVWWSLGGRTSLDNAAWLCPYHHWLVHEGGWRLRKERGRFVFTSGHGEERIRHLEAA